MKIPSYSRCKEFIHMPKSKTLTFIVLGLAMTTGTIAGLATKQVDAPNPQMESNTNLVVARLNALQTQVMSLQEVVKKPLPDRDLSIISEKINQLSTRFEQLKSVDPELLNQRLGETITHTESALGDKLNAIQNMVSHLETKQTPNTYLKPDALPFKVVSIDSIQQVAVASIAYDFKTVPMEKGDSLAGWKVVRVDYGKQRIELENNKKERVLLTNTQIG